MSIEIRIPSPGESISEVEIARWLVEDGAWVDKDQEVAEVESEKATLPLIASDSGIITILVRSGAIRVGDVACTINTSATQPQATPKIEEHSTESKPKVESPKVEPTATQGGMAQPNKTESSRVKVTPLARKLMDEKGVSVDEIISGLRRITSHDVSIALTAPVEPKQIGSETLRAEERVAMSPLRRKLSQRLVAVKNETAMLTTFNEVDMSRVMELRGKYQKAFQEKYGVKLGFMSLFTKAVVEALKHHPMVNSQVDGDEIVTPSYYDIGVAVQTPKGLMVPVLRDVQALTLAQIEKGILELAEKGRVGRIGLDDLAGGTFTITNGGVFGSMLSTPIINPPQSGILGMHSIMDRPIAVNGRVEIRPMMYIALSYDHRIIDGKDSVGFLVKVKQMVENPELILTGGISPDRVLLDL